MADLVAKFENSLGRKHRLRVKNANTDLDPEVVRASLEKLATVDLFHNKKGACLFDKVLTASYFETIDTYIFENNIEEEICEESAASDEQAELRVLAQSNDLEGLPSVSMTDWRVTLIEEQMVEPTVLKQVLELPQGMTLKRLSQEQKRSLVTSEIPEGGRPLEAKIYEQTNPVRIELFVQQAVQITQKVNASPPKDQRKGWRLFDRLTKRRRK